MFSFCWIRYKLSSAYDMVATALANANDDEDLGINLNWKNQPLGFYDCFTASKLDPKQKENVFMKMGDQ